jgi:hypothetical protein
VKVTDAHRDAMAAAIDATGNDRPDIRARYVARDIPRGDLVQDIDKRFRWDLFYAATAGTSMISDLYAAGYNDTHLDTALRSIVTPLSDAAPAHSCNGWGQHPWDCQD